MNAARQPVTLVTGASAGIGAELARVFAANGHALLLVARRGAQLDTLAESIAASGKPRPLVLALDLAETGAAERIDDAMSELGVEPQHIVNNAGFGLLGAASELGREQQLAMIELNVRVLTELSLRWSESLERHRGGVLNVASIAAFMPGPGMAIYHATKAYVLSFSEALHKEMAPRGVRVTALCPGPVDTEFNEAAGIPDDYFPRALARSAERVAREGYEGFMAGRRVVTPGTGNRIVTLLPRLLPRALVLRMMDRRQRG
jgi:short-subunit dehydrogenase